MDYRTIVEKHPDRYVIAAVAERGENNFVSSWEVLSADIYQFLHRVKYTLCLP